MHLEVKMGNKSQLLAYNKKTKKKNPKSTPNKIPNPGELTVLIMWKNRTVTVLFGGRTVRFGVGFFPANFVYFGQSF